MPGMRTPFWTNAFGTPIRLSEMSSDHIRNAWRYVQRGDGEYGPLLRSGCGGFSNAEWLLLFAAELRRRSRFGEEVKFC